MIIVLHATTAAGDRHELNVYAGDEPTARRRAVRAAALLGAVGAPALWAGSRVVAADAVSGRLLCVARIRMKGVRVL